MLYPHYHRVLAATIVRLSSKHIAYQKVEKVIIYCEYTCWSSYRWRYQPVVWRLSFASIRHLFMLNFALTLVIIDDNGRDVLVVLFCLIAEATLNLNCINPLDLAIKTSHEISTSSAYKNLTIKQNFVLFVIFFCFWSTLLTHFLCPMPQKTHTHKTDQKETLWLGGWIWWFCLQLINYNNWEKGRPPALLTVLLKFSIWCHKLRFLVLDSKELKVFKNTSTFESCRSFP